MQEANAAIDLLEALHIKAAAKGICSGGKGGGEGNSVSFIKFGQVGWAAGSSGPVEVLQ
jgi:hypothetical protein